MTRSHRIVSVLLAGTLAPLAAAADSVHLKNGQIFDGVEAEVSGDTVQIDLAIGGRMRLPMSKVERIEEVDSTLGEYRERESLLRHETADAGGWLELARWARAHDFDQGARKAAKVAARLDPELPALEPVMTSLGYVLDSNVHEWLPYDDAMRHQGLVEDRGEWITPEEKLERSDATAEAAPERAGSRTDDHLDKALDVLAAAVSKPDAPAPTVIIQNGGFGGGFGYPGFIGGGIIGGGFLDPGFGGFPGPLARAEINRGWQQLANRQPASFIPMSSNTGQPRLHPVTHRFIR